MQIHTFTGGPVATNAYLVVSEEACFLVDAPEGVANYLEENGFQPTHLLLTHQHFDHVQDVAALQQAGLKVLAAEEPTESLVLEELARQWGLPITIDPYSIDQLIDGDHVTVGELEIRVMKVPGHSPDSLCFQVHESQDVFAGDTLFAQGIGRPDLPGGDLNLLIASIRSELLSLDDSTRIHPGHGPSTTVGKEKSSNSYIQKLPS